MIRIAFFDIDGTLHQGETLWEILHKKNGTWDTLGVCYLEDFLAGKIDYAAFARLDVEAWKGLPEAILHEAIAEITLFSEAIQVFNTLHDRGCLTFLISNGIAQLAEHIVIQHGLTGFVANPVHVKDGHLTGEISLTIPYNGKGSEVRRILTHHSIERKFALAIGDGPADLAMLAEVDHPIFLGKKAPSDFQGFTAECWEDVIRYLEA